MKKLAVSLLCIVMLLSMVGCGGGQDSSDKQAAKEEPVTFRLATQHPVEHMAHTSAEAIKEEIESKTDGRVKIDIYPASQLGDYVQVYEEIMRGSIDMAHISTPEKYDARVTVGFLPYLAKNYEELRKVYAEDSFLSKKMEKIQAESDIKFFGYYCEGFSGVGSVDKLNAPASINKDKNALVRVPGIDAFKLPAERLGFRTSTIPYSDTFASMQTGVVDGWVGGPPNLNYLTFRDVINHYYQYNLTHESTQYLMNKETFESLSAEEQKIIEEAFRRQCDKSFDLAQKNDKKYRKLLEEEGIEVVTFSDKELSKMAQDIRENIWPKLEDKYSKELINGILESLK